MDGVSAAASLIAVATIALQSTKIIYETVTGIHKGPPLIQQLASELQNLQNILKRIVDLSKDPAQTNFTDFQGMEDLSRRCATDVQNMEGKLRNLCGSEKIKRTWNKLKMYVNIKYLEEMRRRIWHHVQNLTAELGVATIDDLGRMNTTMQKYFVSSATQAGLLSEEIKATYGQHTKSVNLLSEQSSRNHLTTMDAMQNHSIDLGRMHNAIEALQHISASCGTQSEDAASSALAEIHQISQAVNSISARLDGLSSISRYQYETLQRMLEELSKNQKARKPSDEVQPHNTTAPLPTAKTINCIEDIPDDREAVADNTQPPPEQLLESIQRLWSLASVTGATYFSEDAQHIIDDFERLLLAASEVVAKRKAEYSRKRASEDFCDDHDANGSRCHRDVKRVRGLLTSSQLVHVAKKGSPQVIEFLRPLTTIQNRCETVQMQDGTLTFLSRSQDFTNSQRRPKGLSQRAGDDRDRNLLEVFTSTVTFIPTNSTLQAKLYASFVQKISKNGFCSIHPTFSFCSIIPKDSIIFEIIAKGKIEDLENLFRENMASVTDCDPKGRSLLNYAHYNNRPVICKFLLQHGADPNSLERGFKEYEADFLPMLLQGTGGDYRYRWFENGADQHMYEETLRCRQLLLDAGSDPYMERCIEVEADSRGETDGYLYTLLSQGGAPIELKKQVVDCDTVWFDMEHDYRNGKTPLLLAVDADCYGICPETVELLIKRGADVSARNWQGQTCLHLAFLRGRMPFSEVERRRRSLTLLVNAGADIYAVDSYGEAVSEVAILDGVWEMWQEVLHDCGKDVDKVYAVLRERGWLFPGDPDYDGVFGRPGDPYKWVGLDALDDSGDSDDSDERNKDNNDLPMGSDSDSNDSGGGVELV